MYSQVAMNLQVWCDISDAPSYLHSSATIMGGCFRGIWLVDMMAPTASVPTGNTTSLTHTASCTLPCTRSRKVANSLIRALRALRRGLTDQRAS